ncbi:alcohol dehydrogenase catalytic domain-containing protein [uncultured Microbacterium sp.]|uniref:alcohol dehydrogenase catalytic domain-containing protein n=1 Tax=uncultured Microbacterium sp. TaxID=191216 RepID=UPI0026327CE7|nr:alcohol dehydrogenase catalytic domain-containing protein [uncultured Microbacterium sp.]
MRHARLYAPGDLRVEEVAVPELLPGDVLIKVDAALLCGTDVRISTGAKTRNVTFPTVLGHEFAGHVVDHNGPLPDGIRLDQQVCIYPLVTCGTCAACRRGRENVCRARTAFGYQLTGGLSQYVRVPAEARQNIVPLEGVSAAEAAIVEPTACAYNGQRLVRSETAQVLLVVGCGPLGLLHIRLAKALGVPHVAAIDPIAARREVAAASGAELVLAPGDDTADRILEWSEGGVDVLIMAIGRTDALTPYFGALAPGARVSVFAGFPASAMLEIAANDIHYNEWEFVGASSCHLDGFHAVAELISSGTVRVDDLIGSVLPLDRAQDALDLAASGGDMRVGVNPWA